MRRVEHHLGERRGAGEECLEASDKEIGLLVALLVRYPEISAVRVEPADAAFRLSFTLSAEPDSERLASFEHTLRLGLGALSRLGGWEAARLEVRIRRHGEISLLDVVRDVDTLSAEEFPVLLGIVKDLFGNLLIMEEAIEEEPVDEDEEFALADSLAGLREWRAERTWIGFRDEGRVLVFHET